MTDPVRYTAAQLEALDTARSRVDTCIVAGPGSGKTTVLVEYYRRLVAEGTDPVRILAITFTEKAAGNMRDKLAKAFRDDARLRARLERAWVSTVHGFCARLLRENAIFAGIDPQFYVADERESWRMQGAAIGAAVEEIFEERPDGMRGLIRGLSSWEFEEALLSAYDAMRGAGTGVESLSAFSVPEDLGTRNAAALLAELRSASLAGWTLAQKEHLEGVLEGAERFLSARDPLDALRAIDEFTCNLPKLKRGTPAYELARALREAVQESKYAAITELHSGERRLLIALVERFDRLYRARKQQAGALDFADLEEYTVRLLDEHPEVRARLTVQFDYVLMDELQDTNGQQARLLELVRPPDRLYAVGDVNQSIFGFRHAEPRQFLAFRDSVIRRAHRLVELEENFRSRAEVLRAVETVTRGLAGIEPRRLIAAREFAKARPLAVEAIAAIAEDAEQALGLEAQCVARRILELRRDDGFAFRQMAVLVRNTEVIRAFTDAFEDAGIPSVVNRGRGFYEAREVNDLVHLLRVIANPLDEISMAAVLRSPLVAVSDEALLRLKIAGGRFGGALEKLRPETETGFDAGDLARLKRFRGRLHEWRVRREHVTFDRLLAQALDESGYRPEAGARGAANIDKFLAHARAAAADMSLDEYVEELALVRASNPREADAPPEDSADAVQVMTVHSAKGLEFPVVFVTAMHKGVESNPPVVAFSPAVGLGARWRNPAGRNGKREEKDDLYQHALRKEWQERDLHESHRLLYVAMTRAEEHLVLSFAANTNKNWAKVVTDALGLDLSAPCDAVRELAAPDGTPWQLRVLAADREPAMPPRPAPEAESLPEPAPLALPEITEQQDSNATVTALAKFALCPREYYLGEFLGLEGRAAGAAESAAAGRLTAGEFGTQVHNLLAGMTIPNADPEAVRLAGVFHGSALGRRAARASRVEREFDFLMVLEDLVIRGQVDLWFEEGGEIVVVDYKTDDVPPAEAHRRAMDYALQLRLYSMAVERVAGRPPARAWLHFLRPNVPVEVDLAPSLVESPEQIAREFQEAQSSLLFPLRESARCRRCRFYRDLCPAGRRPGQPTSAVPAAAAR